ncbi:MAG: hypothetical protein NC548_61070, partial [Lachnospiraceae bacterium]|nr:hypothetical protein [Lachnospiraceae bacterium]
SYNKGYSWQKNEQANIQAEKYYQDVAMRVKQLESYFQKEEIQQSIKQARNASKANSFQIAQKPQEAQKTTQDSTNSRISQSQDYYAYSEDSTDFSLLPIYQVGNEFAAPFKPKKTIIKEFDLIEIY